MLDKKGRRLYIGTIVVVGLVFISLYVVTAFAALAVGFWPWLVWLWLAIIVLGYVGKTFVKARKYLEKGIPDRILDALDD